MSLIKKRKKKGFLPSIIFSIEQEVCTHYGHTDGHNGKDQEYKQHETINIVDFIGPK